MDNPESGAGENPVPAATGNPEKEQVSNALSKDTPPPLSISGRIFATLEHAWFQRVVGMAAVFFGLFDGRYFSIITLMLPLAIHRSKSLRGVGREKHAVIYITSFCLLFVMLWAGGKQWNRNRDNSPLIKAIADAVGAKVSGTIGKLGTAMAPSQPLAAPPKPPPAKPKSDPRLATVIAANELADKIKNVGADYSQQIRAEGAASGKRKMQGIPAKESDDYAVMRMNAISKYERERYEKNYLQEALDLRAKMLELIPDVPFVGLDTTISQDLYRRPVNGFGYTAVGENLRSLANSYRAKVSAKPSAVNPPR
jgi:hypothetical protein